MKTKSFFLMIQKSEGWHYLEVKKLSALLRGATSKYCLNCFNSFINFQFHKRVCENKDFHSAVVSSEDIKMLEFTQTQKSDTTSYIVHADFESLIKIVERCKNNPGNVSTTKRWTFSPWIFNIYDMNIWWYRKQAWCRKRWGLHETFVNP